MTIAMNKRAVEIKRRREALGITFEGFYSQLGLSTRQATFIEEGRFGPVTASRIDKVEEFLTHLEAKAGKVRKESIDRADITARREALKMGIKQFAADIGVPGHDLALAEQGAQGGLMQSILVKADDHLKRLEVERKPVEMKRIAAHNGKWHWASTIVPAGTSMTFRILPNNGKEFTEEELAAFPTLDLTPKPTPEYKAHRMVNDKKATQKQLEKFADGLCLSLLKSERDILTIPWAEFYELLYAATGAGHFDQMLLDTIFSNMTTTSVPFVISFGNNVVVVAKDTLFAPVEFP